MKLKNEKPKGGKTAIKLNLDPNKPEGIRKSLGGGKADEWNDRLNHLTFNALPIAHSKNEESITAACEAVSYGAMDIAPADPATIWEEQGESALRLLAINDPGKLAQIAYGLLPRDVFISVEQRTPGNLEPSEWAALRRVLDTSAGITLHVHQKVPLCSKPRII